MSAREVDTTDFADSVKSVILALSFLYALHTERQWFMIRKSLKQYRLLNGERKTLGKTVFTQIMKNVH